MTHPRGETKDLASDPSHEATIKTLLARLKEAGATGEVGKRVEVLRGGERGGERDSGLKIEVGSGLTSAVRVGHTRDKTRIYSTHSYMLTSSHHP